ncbi:ATP-grasp domain-containing protein [bacterium]|nr:ATP-grasp domain-containing protein [bacterium]
MQTSLFNYLDVNREKLKAYTLFIVCNTKSAAKKHKNYEGFDVATEYLSDIEFEEVISLFSQCNLNNIEIFQSEISFINYILNNEDEIRNKKLIVYSSAQTGTGAGRKSLIPAFCKLEEIPYTGSNPYVVSLCRQKYHTNKLLENAKLPVPNTWLYDGEWLFGHKPLHNQEVLLKPIYESASIGIDSGSLIRYSDESDKDIHIRNINMQQPIIAQQFVEGYEVEFPVYVTSNNIYPILPIGLSLSPDETCMGRNFLNYEAIYFDKYYFYNFESNLNYNKEMVNVVTETVKLLGMKGLCRVDFRVKSKNDFYITDVSTNPHFITHSSINHAFKLINLSESAIAECILLSALEGV